MFDLDLLTEFATEQRFPLRRTTADLAIVDLGSGFCLCFHNQPEANDTGIYFEGCGGSWHTHGDLFADNEEDLALVPINLLELLMTGFYLVEQRDFVDGTSDICLEESRDYQPSLEAGERLVVYRVPAER